MGHIQKPANTHKNEMPNLHQAERERSAMSEAKCPLCGMEQMVHGATCTAGGSFAAPPGSDATIAPFTPEEQEELRRLLEWFKASEKDKTMWDKSPYHPNSVIGPNSGRKD